MTLKELSKTYGYSEQTIKNQFNRTSQSFKKKYGLELFKYSNYKGTFYQVVAPRALTIYEELKDEIYIPIDSLKMNDLACFVLIGVAAMPQGVFRDTKKAFLDYLGLQHSKKNVDLLTEVLEVLSNKQNSPICVQEDVKTVTIRLRDDFEEAHIITVKMLKECQAIAKKYNKKAMKVVQLIKVWQAYRINQMKGINPLTDKNIQQWINLSRKQILDAKKMLFTEKVLDLTRVGNYHKCYGTRVEGNAFYDTKKEVIVEK